MLCFSHITCFSFRRLVDAIYPRAINEGLINMQMQKVTFLLFKSQVSFYSLKVKSVFIVSSWFGKKGLPTKRISLNNEIYEGLVSTDSFASTVDSFRSFEKVNWNGILQHYLWSLIGRFETKELKSSTMCREGNIYATGYWSNWA